MRSGTLTCLTTVVLFGVLQLPVRVAAQNASGKVIAFDAPGAIAVAGSFDGTFPSSINAAGIITGHLTDNAGRNHGFVRMP